MSNYGPRKPLHWQENGLSKAVPKNESYESFRQNEIHEPKYSMMEGQANDGMSTAYRVRRYPNGELCFDWMANQIIDAIHASEMNGHLTPVEQALLTILFPVKFRYMEPQQAEIMTQLSDTEKDMLALMIDQHMAEEANWAAGFGGGGTVRPNNKGKP
jgi:hypothetical protein